MVQKHRERGHTECGFVHRRVHVEVPRTRNDSTYGDNGILSSPLPFPFPFPFPFPLVRFVLDKSRNTLCNFRSGMRPYFLHVPPGFDLVDDEDSLLYLILLPIFLLLNFIFLVVIFDKIYDASHRTVHQEQLLMRGEGNASSSLPHLCSHCFLAITLPSPFSPLPSPLYLSSLPHTNSSTAFPL